MPTSSVIHKGSERRRKNRNAVQLRPPPELVNAIEALIGQVRWQMTWNDLYLRSDDHNAGPIYYLAPPRRDSSGTWAVRHRLRSREQGEQNQFFAQQSQALAHLLSTTDGAGRVWLRALSQIYAAAKDEAPGVEQSHWVSTIAALRAFQDHGAIPEDRFESDEEPADEIELCAQIQIQIALGNVLPALRWHEEKIRSGNATATPLSVLVSGLLGDQETVQKELRSVIEANPTTQVLHHFGYLASKAAEDLEGSVQHVTGSAPLASTVAAAGMYLGLGRFQQRRHDHSGAWKSLVHALEINPRAAWVNESAASIFEWIGALDEAETLYARAVSLEPEREGPRINLARLRTWRGIYEPVRADVEELLTKRPDDANLHRLLGIIHICEGRDAEGVACLNRVLELRPRDAQALLWRADVSFREGRWQEATEEIEQASVSTSSPAEYVQRMLVSMDSGEFCAESIREVLGNDVYSNGFFERHLPHLATPEELEVFLSDQPSTKTVLESLLVRFGGNRSDIITVQGEPRRKDGSGTIRSVELPKNSRDASTAALKRLRYESADRVLERFDGIIDTYPDSPHPHCYRGEVLVWLGRYDESLAAFEAGLKISEVRWGYVGKAAVLMLQGHKVSALEAVKQCGLVFEPLPGATTHVYLGELLRRENDYEGADKHLTEALEIKPTRYGALMNLAMVRHATGRAQEATEMYERLWDVIPGLLWTAGAQLGVSIEERCDPSHMIETMEEALRMMRGNRSSHLITYFPNDGRMRIAPTSGEWEEVAWESLSVVEESLLTKI